VKEQLNAAHHLNRLSDTNETVFNFVAKVLYEDTEPDATETKAAAEWIDEVMLTRHEAGKQSGGRPRDAKPGKDALYRRELRARKKSE
jgi:hypothetical protein